MKYRGEAVAVIGMAGRFPGADDVAGFWRNLCEGRDGIRDASDQELLAAGVSVRELTDPDYVRATAPLDGVDQFDPGFFKISPIEAELMDPQLRLLLQCAWATLEDAGYACGEPLPVGVFTGAGGVGTSYFANYVNLHPQFEKVTASPTHMGNDKDFLSTYLSYKLNLTGPSMTVQTACSTSLVALHQARQSLLSGECEMALAGGVSVRVPHAQGYVYREGYIFSRSGRVRSFDADADGVVFGSGLGLVLIKRLQDALRDGDPIHAVIRGSAIGNDGRAKLSYAASSARGQIACVRAALAEAEVDPSTIGLVEAHGTGTAMGDPEEVKALSAAFREHTEQKAYCALGAVKSSIGHLEAAAGIVGFIKAVLAVKHGLLPPNAHFERPNPKIRFETSPFYVNTDLRTWGDATAPRRAAVNSLGVGGTNAFVVIEEHRAARSRKAARAAGPVVVPLSARTEASLRAYAERLLHFLDAGEDRPRADQLSALAYTLQTGRVGMSCRVAFVVNSLEALRAALRGYLQNQPAAASKGRPGELARRWQAGEPVDWSSHYAESPRRLHLPGYVFARERCWIEPVQAATGEAPYLHPLLHANTSDLNEQRYRSRFAGDEFFLRDHRLRLPGDPAAASQAVLPAVAYLEMARAAVQQAAPLHCDTQLPELRDLVWLQPITVAAPVEVNIALVAQGQDRAQRVDFEIYTQDDQIHCQGRCHFLRAQAVAPIDLVQLAAGMQQGEWSPAQIYAAFTRMGLEYGPAHRALGAVRFGQRELLAELRLPELLAAGSEAYGLHPSLLDGALQAATLLLIERERPPEQPLVPFALESLRLLQPGLAISQVHARHAGEADDHSRSARLDIDLCDAEGRIAVAIRGFVPRPLGRPSRGQLLATRIWEAMPIQAGEVAQAEPHVLLCDLPQIEPLRIARDCQVLARAETADPAAHYAAVAEACFDRLQRLMQSRLQTRALVQLVVPDTAEGRLLAGLAAMFRSAQLENPLAAGQVVLVDPQLDSDRVAALLHAERAHPHDALVRHSARGREVAGWQLLDPKPAAADVTAPLRHGGVYLITGGLGGLGLIFAREFAERGSAVKLILSGRAAESAVAADADRQSQLAGLAALGASVEYRCMDPCDPAAVQATVAAIQASHGALHGILHSAGMTHDGFILKKSREELQQVLAPKVQGTVNLDRASAELDLDFLLLFSSLSAAVGNVGQADYAAANGFMDEFAAYRNQLVSDGQRRGHSLAIRWPLWREGGMQLDAAGREQLRQLTGIEPLQTATGLRLFHRSLALGLEQCLAMEGELAQMQRSLSGGAALHASSSNKAAIEPSISADGAPATDLQAGAETLLCEQFAQLLKLPRQRVSASAPLEDYGIDSILALDLTRALERNFGPLPKTLFFEYQSIRELAAYLVQQQAPRLARLLSAQPDPSAAPVEPAAAAPEPAARSGAVSIRALSRRASVLAPDAQRPAAADAVAIIGISGRYPLARDLEAYWRNLRDGRDCIVEVPKERWDWRDYYSEDRSEKGRHYSRWGGFIEGVDEFDARFFGIAPVEADLLDPQERLFLEQAWLAIEDAGLNRAALQVPHGDELPAQVGVYAGVMYGEYQLLGAEASLAGEHMGFASNLSSIANRVSYVLNLHGPSLAVDTMCSSSLTAIHLACQDLKLGRTDLALAGGVNVSIHPNKYLMLSAGQFISGDGHCQSFGEGGDGYIPGEGVGVVVLKRLADAERDGDLIHGLIRGSALSHGGRTHGYTVPNPQAQASAVRQALAEAGIHPRQIGYIEAHGTGTRLGDPIEIAGLQKVFREHTEDRGFCLIGSAKSNIGHCEAAAGIAGLSKVLLQLKHAQIVPSLHSSRLNPHIDFDSTPFVVNQSLRDWPRPRIDGVEQARVAGISSFGAGGANAHLIIEEYRPAAEAMASTMSSAAQLLPISARSEEQLRQKVRDLLDFLAAEALPPALDALAYSLQVGREPMEQRLCLRAESLQQASERLRGWLEADGDTERDGLRRGQARAGRERLLADSSEAELEGRVEHALATASLDHLAELWVQGMQIDWARLHRQRPQRLRLPTYPFARQRHWADAAQAARQRARRPAALHPLLHTNVSDLHWHRYQSRFEAGEPFLQATTDGPALAEAAALEMAREALQRAVPELAGTALELADIAWAQPRIALAGRPLSTVVWASSEDAQAAPGYCFEISLEGVADQPEQVLCQGRARVLKDPAATAPAAAAQPPRQLQLRPSGRTPTAQNFGLDPELLQQVLQHAEDDSPALPLRLQALQILQPSALPAQARFQLNTAGGLDVELLDAAGTPCLRLRGLQQTSASAPMATPSSVIEPSPKLPHSMPTPAFEPGLPRAIEFARPPRASQPAEATSTDRALAAAESLPVAAADKPQRSVRLSAPLAALPESTAALPAKPRLTLPPLLAHAGAAEPATTARAQPAASAVQLLDLGEGVFALRVLAEGAAELDADLIADLRAALSAAAEQADLRALLLQCSAGDFLSGDAEAHRLALASGLYQELLQFPLPLIAEVRGDAMGAGLLCAALCDFLVLAESARCQLAWAGLRPAQAAPLLNARFGSQLAEPMLYFGGVSAAELGLRGLGCPILPIDQVQAQSLALARTLASKPAPALRLLKSHLAQPLLAAFSALTDCSAERASEAARVEIADLAGSAATPADGEGLSLQRQGALLRVRLQGDALLSAPASVLEALETLLTRPDPDLRCLLLESPLASFLPQLDAPAQAHWAQRLQRALWAAPYAVIALSAQGARGLGWYAALICDACLHVDSAEYAIDAAPPASMAALALAVGEGMTLMLATGAAVSGAELGARTALRVCAASAAESEALRLAEQLAALASDQLRAWREQRMQGLQDATTGAEAALGASDAARVTEASDQASEPAAALLPGSRQRSFGSGVVEAELLADGVMDLRLRDRAARNMFTPELSAGLREALAWAEQEPACKVVVLSGYDSYFSSGGTPETLLAIHAGEARFTDNPLFELPLACNLPVVAALQGHGLGAGWALGMFADISLLSTESRYCSPYMDYGFTPGAGATAVFPARIGLDLARETLLTAHEFDGEGLAARGLRQTLLPRAQVLPAALALAQRLAQLPRTRLIALKRWLAADLRAALPAVLQRELDMHALSYVGQAEPLARIQARLRPQPPTQLEGQHKLTAAPVGAAANLPSIELICGHLRSLLADELRMSANEIAENEQFVDLGLDSITGVTWVRRINAHYGTAIEAIRVYSYPTLARLAEHLHGLLQEAADDGQTNLSLTPTAPNDVAATGPAPVADSAGILQRLRALLADELRLPEQEIGEDEQFVDLGLDSITGVTWVRRINQLYGTEIEAIRVYSYPTLRRLAEHVAAEAQPSQVAAATAPAPHSAQSIPAMPAAAPQPMPTGAVVQILRSWRQGAAPAARGASLPQIAVVGMAGRFAMADNLDQFWSNLAAGRDCIEEIPPQRWDIEACFQAGEVAPGKTYSRWMGVLADHDCFDAGFFNISPREARSMDPQQRVFLQACWHALEHAGHAPASLAGSRCGVFVGCSAGDYHQLSRREALSGQGFTGAAPSILAARISYLLDLHGPSLSIDTACSSSLVAIASACDSLALGSSDLALAGGVNVLSGPAMQIMTAQVGMLSPHGRCFSFDARADGIVNGEGVGVLVLKRVAEAERAGDHIYGVIEGWGVNQDGRTNGITAPNPEAQTRLQTEVHRRFGIDVASIGLIEAHGTGTALGDPIEVAGLSAAFAPHVASTGVCALGSVKSTIGHCLTAAGVSGVLKVLLALKHRQLPPSLHFERPNPHLSLERSPFYVNTRLQPWQPRGGRRRAAVNSFGFSGTNAHLVIAEHSVVDPIESLAAPVLVPLSARNSERLRASAAQLLEHLRADPQVDLQRLAYTLQVGRDAMAERLALVVDSTAALEQALQAWISSGSEAVVALPAAPAIYRGDASSGSSTLRSLAADPDFGSLLQKWIGRAELPRLAELWTQGLALPWEALLGGRRPPRRLGLPGYPFARERHWLQASTEAAPAELLEPANTHPLRLSNRSDLEGQRYVGRIEQAAFCLGSAADDRQPAQLMASTLLTLARAGLIDALPAARAGAALELYELEWLAPLPAGALSLGLAASVTGEVALELCSDTNPGEPQLFGWARVDLERAPAALDLAVLRRGLGATGAAGDLLGAQAQRLGLDFGLLRQCVGSLYSGPDGCLLQLQLPATLSLPDLGLHPLLLEAALQCAAALADSALAQPQALASLRLLDPQVTPVWAWLQAQPGGGFDIDLCAADGSLSARLRGLRFADPVPAGAVAEVPVVAQVSMSAPGPASPAAVQQLPELRQIQRQLAESLAEALYLQTSEIDPARSFTELGLDSIIGVEWVKAINRQFGLGIAATLVYDYPNLGALAAHLRAEFERLAAASSTPPARPDSADAPAPMPPASVPQSQADPAPGLAADGAGAAAPSPAMLLRELQQSLAEALFMQPADIDPLRSFSELGLDSIIGVEWVRVLNRRFNLQLAATQIYDYPCLQALAAHIGNELSASQPIAAQSSAAPTPSPSLDSVAPATPAMPVAAAKLSARLPQRSLPRPKGRRSSAIEFRPKYGAAFTGLYFHSAWARGDFEADGEFELRSELSPEHNVCLREHVVFGEHLLPTDAYIELVYTGFRSYFDAPRVSLEQISLVNPLLGRRGSTRHLRLSFRRAEQGLQFFLRSSHSADFADEKLHAQGFIRVDEEPVLACHDDGFEVLATLPASAIPTNTGRFYAPLAALHFGERQALGEIQVAAHDFGFLCSPFATYGGLCTVINFGAHAVAAKFGASEDQFLPCRIGRVRLLAALDQQDYRCYAELRSLERDAVELYFELLDRSGKPVLVVESIQLRRVAASSLRAQIENAPAVTALTAPLAAREPVAVIGLSCRLPMADDAEALWQNLLLGRDCVVEVPAQRWGELGDWYHPEPRQPDRAYSRWAGLLQNIDEFDALFFGISPAEAELIDPQQRVFLQECWKTIENAGYAPSNLSNRACGVYVGCGGGDYARLLADCGQDGAGASFMGTSNAILAARIAYQLNLKGPALAIDTACSSSLVAVHLACESLRSGECELALAGGINLLTTSIGHILTSQVGMPSRAGRCASFDASADGIVFSEGCGVVLLKPLSAALRDDDDILGVIVGSGINQDGRSNGITAPSSTAQQRLLREVYQRFAIDPARIGYVEAHGTATALGDPIEVNALRRVFADAGAAEQACALGSIKSNLGHTGFAAGVAGLIKALLCLRHRRLVPSLHYRQPNPHIEFEGGPFYVNTESREWLSQGARLAAVSSFGFSGTNAHVVIEESPLPAAAAPPIVGASGSQEVLVPLSARTAAALQAQVSALLQALQTAQPQPDLQRLACTLQTGRDPMPHRLALRAHSVDGLIALLQRILDGQARIEGVHRGQANRADDALAQLAADSDMHALIGQWMRERKYERLADLWVRGFELEFSALYTQGRPRRLALPTYPFAPERCWVSAAATRRSTPAAAVLHPLLQHNCSDLGEQRYRSRFDGSEFFLSDHRVQGVPVLPAVAYLEMARAALLDAVPGQIAGVLELQHVAWSQPLRLQAAALEVEIVVFAEEQGRYGFEVSSGDSEAQEPRLHCQGSARFLGLDSARVDLAALRLRMQAAAAGPEQLYPRFAERGLDYGPGFRGIGALWRGENELLVELTLPAFLQADAAAFALHPSLLDSALQGSIELLASIDAQPRLPFAVDSVRVFAPCRPRMFAWVRQIEAAQSGALCKVDIDLCDSEGAICVQLHGFSSLPMSSDDGFDEAHYRSIIAGLLNQQLTADQAMELG